MRDIWIALIGLGLCACSDSQTNPTEAAQSSATPDPGREIFDRFCFSCHATGVAGAPKSQDAAAWADRSAKGKAALLQSVLDGVPPGMPPKGLCSYCTQEQLSAAIDYMIPSVTPAATPDRGAR